LRRDLGDREPAIREKTAAGTFLAEFYSGIENILKRISIFLNCSPKQGPTWHLELFSQFCSPLSSSDIPLFDESLASALIPYRKFRHVVHHAYGFQLEWNRMKEGIDEIESVFSSFRSRLSRFLDTIRSKREDRQSNLPPFKRNP